MTRWWCCAAVVLCVAACSAQDTLPWWRTANIYQIYPRSFKDSDGDGLGDLKGITQKADYFKEIGVDAVWLSPIFTSPMVDFGYDISNFTDIDPVFGTMQDFDAMSKKFSDLGIKLLMDFVPNHSSDQHEWFQKSVRNDSDYRDFYIWRDPNGFDANGNPIPPNNWLSIFGGGAWEWSDARGQFYYHAFRKQQPDLNFRNPYVVGNMTAVLEFWMDKGVDGFRVDAVPWMFENSTFPDDPVNPNPVPDPYFSLLHVYDMNQPETFTLLEYWSDVVYRRSLKDEIQRAVLLEVYAPVPITMLYYGVGNQSLQYPFNFQLMLRCDRSTRATDLRQVIYTWLNSMPEGAVPNWVLGNHDNRRAADRFGPEMVDAMNILTGILPGVKVTFNGEEIGMQDTYIRPDQTVDIYQFSRDPFRTPFQWDSTLSAGFSTNPKPWLPVNPNYWWLNVDAQRKAQTSHLKVFQAMAQARKDPVLQRGSVRTLVLNVDTLLLIRHYNDDYYVLLINMGSEDVTHTSDSTFMPNSLDMDMSVVVGSMNSGYNAGTTVKRGSINLVLRPKAAVLLRSSSVIARLSMLALMIVILAFFLK